MLELDDADRLLGAVPDADRERTRIPTRRSTRRASSSSPNRCRDSASTSTRSLHQRPDRERIIAPLIAKRLGEAPQPVVGGAAIGRGFGRRAARRVAARSWPTSATRRPTQTARDELRGKLASLRDDADLIGDGELVAQANAALKEIDGGGESAALAASVELIVEAGARTGAGDLRGDAAAARNRRERRSTPSCSTST